MVSPNSPWSPSWKREESASDLATAASALHCVPLSSSPGSGPYHVDTILYSTPSNHVDFDPAGVQGYYSAFVEPNSSFGSNDSDAILTPVDLTRGPIPWFSSRPEYGPGPTFTENPAMDDALRASDQVVWYSLLASLDALQIPCTTSPKPQLSSLAEDMEENPQTIVGSSSDTFAFAEIPHPGWDIGHSGSGSSLQSPPAFDFVDPAVGIDGSPYSGGNIQLIGVEVSCMPTFPAEEPPGESVSCEWIDKNGAVCGEAITRASLPGHLSKHGIKNMTRNHPTKCKWVGCKSKKHMNRESIVRHIREVHMRLKRPPRRVEEYS